MDNPRRHAVTRFVLAATLFCVSLGAQSAVIRVSQESAAGAGDFDTNVLGFIDSYSTPLTIANYYQYDTPDAASYNGDLNGGPAPISSFTQSFFVEANDGLHYVVVYDNPADGSGGTAQMTTVLAGGAGGSAAFSVEDDPAEGTTVNDLGSDRIFDTNHLWFACCTDGYAIGELGSDFLLLAAFDAAPTGITNWQVTANAFASIALDFSAGRNVRFDIAPIPLPAAVWLFATALAIVGFLGKRRQSG